MKRTYYYSVNRMKPKNICAVCLFLFICTGGVSAQDAMRLSPQDAVDLAVRSNLTLESSRVTLDNRQRKADLVWNQFLPSISVSGTLNRDNQEMTAGGGTVVQGVGTPVPTTFDGETFDVYPGLVGIRAPTVTRPRWSMMGSLSASLTFSFALIEGIKSIRMDYQTGLINLDKAKLQLERDIRKSYNQILLLEENVNMLRESYASAQRQAATAEANYQAGLTPRLTMLQAQVQVSNMRPNIDDMENNLSALKGSFAMNLGLPYNTLIGLEPFTPEDFNVPLDLADLIAGAVTRKPDIIELRQNIATLQSNRKAQALQMYTPYLNFNWSVSRAFMGDPWKDGWFDSDNWGKGGSFSITLGYSLNSLFPFTTQGQALKDLDNTIRNLNITLAQAVMGTELEIFSKLNSLQKTLATEEVQRAAVDLAQLSYDLTYEAYRAGLQDFQAVQSAATALDQAKLQLLTQRFNYVNDLIDLEYAIGVPFGTLSGNRSIQ